MPNDGEKALFSPLPWDAEETKQKHEYEAGRWE